MNRLIAIALLLLLPALAQADPLPVVVSFSVLGDMVRQVGGEDVAVTVLVGPDSDSHVYEPSPSDTRRLAAARLFVVNGLGLEGWMPRLIDSAGFKGRVVTVTDGITPLQLTEAGKMAPDPHAWQDLANGRIYARNIATALAEADPDHAAAYAQRAAAYDAELAVLDDWVKAEIGSVPPERRKIVTTHDAFQYFGHAYGVAFEAPVGMNEESEPDARAVAALIRQIRQEHIRALFIENMTDPRLLDQLARETGTKPAGSLLADALSKPGEGGETYVALFRRNVPAMVAAMMGN
jgi:zinc/manganese transport system substrate-binding protein